MDNTVENQIILLVEGFINTMIEMHNCGPEEEERLYGVAEGQLLELTDKALLLLGGREEYLETMLFQLISQKLPQGAVMDCFGNFREDLDQVIARTLEVYHRQQMGLSDDLEDYDEFHEPDANDIEDIEDTEDIDDEFSEGVKDEDSDVEPEEYSDEYSIEETIIDGSVIGEGESLDDEYEMEAFEAEGEGDAFDGEDYEISQLYDDEDEDDEDGEARENEWALGDSELDGADLEESDLEDEEIVLGDEESVDVDTEVVAQETVKESGKEDAFGASEDLWKAAELEQTEEASAPEEDTVEDEDLLGRMVRLMFPGKEIICNYLIYDISLDYYVPELDLAFIGADSTTTITSIGELWLRKAGIAVFKVNTEDIYNIKSFRRRLRRLISEKNFEEKRIFDLSAE